MFFVFETMQKSLANSEPKGLDILDILETLRSDRPDSMAEVKKDPKFFFFKRYFPVNVFLFSWAAGMWKEKKGKTVGLFFLFALGHASCHLKTGGICKTRWLEPWACRELLFFTASWGSFLVFPFFKAHPSNSALRPV